MVSSKSRPFVTLEDVPHALAMLLVVSVGSAILVLIDWYVISSGLARPDNPADGWFVAGVLLSPLALVPSCLLGASWLVALGLRSTNRTRQLLAFSHWLPRWPVLLAAGIAAAALCASQIFPSQLTSRTLMVGYSTWLLIALVWLARQLRSMYVVQLVGSPVLGEHLPPQEALELSVRRLWGAPLEGAVCTADAAGLRLSSREQTLLLQPFRVGSLGPSDAADALRFVRGDPYTEPSSEDWAPLDAVTMSANEYRGAPSELPDLSAWTRLSDVIIALAGAGLLALWLGLHIGLFARTWTTVADSPMHDLFPPFMRTRSWRLIGTWELSSGCVLLVLAWRAMSWVRIQRFRWGERSSLSRRACRSVVVFTRAELPSWPVWLGLSASAVLLLLLLGSSDVSTAPYRDVAMFAGPIVPLAWLPLLLGGLARMYLGWLSLRILQADAGGLSLRRPLGQRCSVERIEQRSGQLRLTMGERSLIVH